MGDLGTHSPALLLARIAVERDAQEIVIAGKELRLAEIQAEKDRIALEGKRAEEQAADIAKTIAKMDDGIDKQRLHIKQREFLHIGIKNTLRLLEVDEEREAISKDIEASRAHIANLSAEASQQTTRLKES